MFWFCKKFIVYESIDESGKTLANNKTTLATFTNPVKTFSTLITFKFKHKTFADLSDYSYTWTFFYAIFT